MSEEVDLRKLLKTTGKYISILEANEIKSLQDLLWYLPRAHEDRTQIKTLSQLAFDETIEVVKGKIVKKSMIRTPRGKKMTEIAFIDEEEQKGHIQALNSSYLLRAVQTNKRYYIIGKPANQYGKIAFRHPEIAEAHATEGQDTTHVGRIFPIYSDLQGIKGAWFSKKIGPIVEMGLQEIQDPLPKKFLETFNQVGIQETLRAYHHPESFDALEKARERILFDKMLRIQLASQLTKKAYQEGTEIEDVHEQPDWEHIRTFLHILPFELTGAQKRSLKELIEDIHAPKPMLRLMQGDVGSGKTVVATAAAWYVITKFSGQAVLLAPIEVLAIQHYKNLAKLLLPLGIRIELLTGATPAKEKTRIKKGLDQGTIQLAVGTHALLQDDVSFHDLQFAIIDEQHKFGVRQRGVLQRHGSPHMLQMTATPIPRSLALAFFGEFDVSTIDELPAGRKPITTKIISEEEFMKFKPWILTRIQQGQKVFLITPLIEESDALDEVKAATQLFQTMESHYQELAGQIGLLHGKMKSDQKEEIMQKFKTGTYTFLVSTTVIEVGIDVPEATVMIIVNAERFGLSQLHQLRGRVGRSDLQSYCFLETKHKSGETYKRLKHMEATNDGFELAEIDLKYRGPGEFLGVRQSGETDIPLHLLSNTKFLEKIQQAAQWLIEENVDTSKFLDQGQELQLI